VINIRYHIITLVAVFLALAVGIVAGSTVIQQSLVNNLEDNVTNVEKRLDDMDKRNSALNEQLTELRNVEKGMDTQAPEQLLKGRLVGTSVLMIGVDGIDENPLGSLQSTMMTAGATMAGTVWLRDRLALTDAQSAEDLGEILVVSTRNPASLQAELAQRLGDLLSIVAAPSAAGPTTATTKPAVSGETAAGAASRLLVLLEDLQQARFVDLGGGLAQASAADLIGVRLVVAGGPGAKLDDNAVMFPLLDRLGRDVQPVAVAVESASDDPTVPRGAFVADVRNDRRLRARLSTVDDTQSFAGWAATVLALDDLGKGRVGHYGVADGADRLLPAASP
jgi:hypothetical protein